MNYLIVADSSADLATRVYGKKKNNFASVPLKIITSEKEYIDDEKLNVELMVCDLENYSGRSYSSCPNQNDWIEAFGEAEYVFCVTITSGLSGSYNSACAAKVEYESEHPGRKVLVIDSLSTGPEMILIVEKLSDLIHQNLDFNTICQQISEYQNNTHLIFMLQSMKNLVNNGRVKPLTAKLAGILGIRVIGKADEKGTLEQLEKCRGEHKALSAIIEQMKKHGFDGGKVRITHCINSGAAADLKNMLINEYKNIDVEIYPTRGLCSYYAERGGLLIGFES